MKNLGEKFVAFSIALDENTENFKMIEYLLLFWNIKDTTRRDGIFEEIVNMFSAFKLNWSKLSDTRGFAMIERSMEVVPKINSELLKRNNDINEIYLHFSELFINKICAKSLKLGNKRRLGNGIRQHTFSL